MLKITIKAADESTLNRILHSLGGVVDAGPSTGSGSLERFDTDALLTEARRRFSKDGYSVNVVPDESTKEPEPPKSEPEAAKRRGRPPRSPGKGLGAAPAAANGPPAAPEPEKPPPPAPSRAEVIDALEKYAGLNGMIKAREIIADVSGVKNAALKDVNSVDYRRLMEALAC
jgi:hypothetical protein